MGTIWGKIAPTAGVCTPAPMERIIDARNIRDKDFTPDKKNIARIRVAKLINKSEKIINFFLLYLSAQTPAKREIKIWGKKVQRMEIVIRLPEDVSRVIYQIIAKPTIDEPKREIV
jgi:hypothetical protein